MRNRTRSMVAALLLLSAPVAATASEAPPDELIARYEPRFDEAEHREYRSAGPVSWAAATGSALRSGTFSLWGGVNHPSPPVDWSVDADADAQAQIFGTPVRIADAGLRIEATVQLDAWTETAFEVAVAQPVAGWGSVEPIRLGTGFVGTDREERTIGWVLPGFETEGVEMRTRHGTSASGLFNVEGLYELPCGGTEITPSLDAYLHVTSRDSSSIGQRSRQASLEAQVLELRVYRVPSLGCFEQATVRVLDNSFDPEHLVVRSGDEIVLDESAAENDHIVMLDGPTNDEDACFPCQDNRVRVRVPGLYSLYCSLHPKMFASVQVDP